MREALLILRKDIDHQRWQLCAFLLLVLSRGVIDIILPRHTGLATLQVDLGFLFLVAAIGLMYDSVWQEKVPGDEHYWLTRPMAWSSVVAAKALFLLLFIVLPAVMGSAIALLANGQSPVYALHLAPSLIETGALVMTLAAVTRTPVQFFLTLVVSLVLYALSTILIEHLFGFETVLWGGAQRIRSYGTLVVECAVMTLVIGLQYQRRATALSLGLAGVGMVVLLVGLPGWRLAFTTLEKLEGPGASGQVQLAFDAARPAASSPGSWSNATPDDVVGVRIPVTISGIPAGAALEPERYRATIDVPGGAHWDSGWRSAGGIIASSRFNSRRITGDAEYWLELEVDRSFFDGARLQDRPVAVHSEEAFAILSAPQVAQLPVPCSGYRAAPDQLCTVSIHRDEQVTIECLSHSMEHLPQVAYWQMEGKVRQSVPLIPRDAGQSTWSVAYIAVSLLNFEETRFDKPLNYQPFRVPDSVRLETRRTEGYFERSLDIAQVRLGPYEAGRSHGRRVIW